MNIKKFIEQKIISILSSLDIVTDAAFVSQSNRPDLSDYQSNVAMALAKKNGTTPRELAQKIVEKLQGETFVSKATVDHLPSL